MLNEFYHNIGIKGYFRRYGFVNAVKRGVFIANPFHIVRNYEIKKLLWQGNAAQKVRKYLKYKDTFPEELSYGNIHVEDPVWIYWHSSIENAPDIVKACYRSVVKYVDKKIIVLSEDNIENYVILPKYIKDKKSKGMISMAAYTDLIRVALLAHYGGLWIDATVYITNSLPVQLIDQDFFVFSNSLGLIENPVLHPLWFIRAKAQGKVIKEIRNVLFAYWVKERYVCEYLLPNIIVTEILNRSKNDKQEMLYLNSDYSEYFVKILGDKYDQKKFDWVRRLADIHKLTYKLDDSINKEGSFYNALVYDELDK